MGLMDTIKGWFVGNKGAASGQADTIKSDVDKAGDAVDDKTGGKFSGQVDSAQDAAKGAVDKIAGEGEATAPGTSAPEAAAPDAAPPES